jgi:uncharacterized HAD superfamily protein
MNRKKDFVDYTFNELSEYVEELEASREKALAIAAEAEQKLDAWQHDEQIVALNEQLDMMESICDTWVEMANDMYNGLLMAEDQLSKHGIGLRPLAQNAMRMFEDLTEDDGD